MRSIIGLRPVASWAVFLLVVSIPTVLLEIRSWNTAWVEGRRMTTTSFNERMQTAASIRSAIDRSNEIGQKAMQSVSPHATMSEARKALAAAAGEREFGVGFVYAKDMISIVTDKSNDDPTRLEAERRWLKSDPVMAAIEEGHNALFSATGFTFTTGDLDSVNIRKLESGVEIGWVVDAATIEQGAKHYLPAHLAIERAPSAASDEIPAAPKSDDLTIFSVTPKLRYRIVEKDPARVEANVIHTRNGVMAFSSACIFALVVFAGAIFARARQAQKLADLRTDFVAAVSHELRTPLASVRMFAELLEAGDVPEDERKEVETTLAGETRRLHATLDRMLRFGALARGKLVVEKRLQPIAPIVQEAAKRRNVTIECDPALAANVDGGMLGLAIENLLSNAVKYAPSDRPYVVRARSEANEIVIDVIDHGPGLSAKAQKKIFSPFERADARLSKATEGSGVGLALVRGIAEAHGGSATVSSKLGEGSTFTLRLGRA